MNSQHQKLGATGGGGNGKDPVFRSYTSNATWTPPTDANFYGAEIICVGAGGGGGGGRQGAQNTNRFGGQMGGGGTMVRRFMRAAELPAANYQITIGAGGAGGDRAGTWDTHGLQGTTGGATIFESTNIWVQAQGGNAGRGGTNASSLSLGISALESNIPGGIHVLAGAAASSYSITIHAAGQAALSNFCAGAAGGPGGSINSTNQYDGNRAGLAANGIWDQGFLLANYPNHPALADSGVNGDNGTSQSFYWYTDTTRAMPIALGSGGGGGAVGLSNSAGNGGNGGRAAGGGGGGASWNGTWPGNGGSGGNGCCVIIEYFGA